MKLVIGYKVGDEMMCTRTGTHLKRNIWIKVIRCNGGESLGRGQGVNGKI